jgi:hypothetical protein
MERYSELARSDNTGGCMHRQHSVVNESSFEWKIRVERGQKKIMIGCGKATALNDAKTGERTI